MMYNEGVIVITIMTVTVYPTIQEHWEVNMSKRKSKKDTAAMMNVSAAEATTPTEDAQPEISVTVLRPGSKGKRSFSVVKGTTWGELMKKFKFSLKDGWRASVGGTLIGDNDVLQDGDGIKLGNQPRNG